jgi:hypothetical protein
MSFLLTRWPMQRRVIMDTLGVILGGSRDGHLERLGSFLSGSTNQMVSTRLGYIG